MAEVLTLTATEIMPDITTWRVAQLAFDVDTPSMAATLRSNTGAIFRWSLTPNPEDPTVEADIRAGLSFINQGKFATIQGKSLQRWILEQISTRAVKIGTVSGTPS